MKTAREFCGLLNLEEEITEDIVALEKKVSCLLGDKILLLAKSTLKDGITEEEFQQLDSAGPHHGGDRHEVADFRRCRPAGAN